MSTMINRYVAKLIESWVLEVMTLYTRDRGSWPGRQKQIRVFHLGFTPKVFSTAKSALAKLVVN